MKKLYRSLYFQVLVAITLGVLLGYLYPETGAKMKPLGDGFIKLIKMLIAPVIFCTVVMGITGVEDMQKVGKTGGLALIPVKKLKGARLRTPSGLIEDTNAMGRGTMAPIMSL